MLVHTRMYTSDRYNTLAQVIITVSKETGRGGGGGGRAAWYAGEAREQRKLNRAESRSNCEEKEYLTNGAKGKNRGRESVESAGTGKSQPESYDERNE